MADRVQRPSLMWEKDHWVAYAGKLENELRDTKRALEAEEASCLEEIGNRDEWEDTATKLAEAVGEYFGVSVGEHSSANDPIAQAHMILNGEYQTKVTAIHASIIEQGRLVQIGASGESKYGAMSVGEYIEWVKTILDGKQ